MQKRTSRILNTSYCIFLIGLALLTAPSYASPPVNSWSAPLYGYIDTISDNPFDVVASIESSLGRLLDTPEKAANYALLCRAYNALLMNKKAGDASQKGMQLITREGQAWLYHQLALCYASSLDNGLLQSEAKSLVLPAIRWAEDNGAYDLLSYGLAIDGYLDLSLHNLDNALGRFQEGYRLTQQHPTQLAPSDFASMIALVYEYRFEPELTLPYFLEAERYYREKGARFSLSNTLFGLGRANLSLNNTEKGLDQIRESTKLSLEIGDLQGAAYSYQELATYLISQGKVDNAKEFLEKALSIFKASENRYMQINVLLSMASIAVKQKQADTAQSYLDQADSLAEGDGFIPAQIAINDRKAQLFASLNNYQKAYALMSSNVDLGNTLYKNENSQRLLELKTRFEVDQQKIKNDLLQEQNLRQQAQLKNKQALQRYGIAVVGLLIVISFLLGYLYLNGRRQRERFEKLANQDVLTGVMSRRNIMDRLEHQIELSKRVQSPLSVAVIDLDFFKKINDTFGHPTGDAVLREFGSLALNMFRISDGLGRVGGEEFLFFFPHTDIIKADELLQRFASSVRKIPDLIGQPNLHVSFSAGLTAIQHKDETRAILARADKALYQAKNNGRDRVEIAKD